MSNTYPKYTNSSFPDSIDQFDLFSDVTIDMLPYVKQYQSFYSSGDLNRASQLLIDHPEMKNMVINSSNLNRIIDAIKCIETLYSTDIQTYIMELVSYKGSYSSKQKYSKYDVVSYEDSMMYMCISLNTPLATPPTDTSFWIPLSLKGDKGESGTGLSPRGKWDSETQYYKDDLVSYNNQLWAAKGDNINSLPNNDSTIWYSVLYSDVTKDYVDEKYNELFQSVSNGKVTVANAITDKGVETNATDTFATMANNISQIETGIHTIDATATANQILENCTAYVNDIKVTGTMTDFSKGSNGDDVVSPKFTNQPIVNTVGNAAVQYGTWGINLDKEGLIVAPKQGYYPNTSEMTSSYMYIPASTVASRLSINPYKIVKGYTIAGIQGTADTSGGITNFPLTISITQPTPIDVGHIWINTSRVSNPRCYIMPYIYDSVPNNSVIFVIGTYANMYHWESNNANGYITEIYNQGSTRGWRAGYKNGNFETWLPTPMVYTKVNNITYIETTYMWDGNSWICISNADKYLIGIGYASNLFVGNITNNIITEKSTGIKISDNLAISKNGEMMSSYSNTYDSGFAIVKRIGDTFSIMQEVSKEAIASVVNKSDEDKVHVKKILLSSDARYMLVFVNTEYVRAYDDYTVTSMHMIRYKLNNDKTQYDLLGDIIINNSNEQYGIFNADASGDLSTIVISYCYGAGYRATVYVGDIEAGYTRNNIANGGIKANVAVSPNGVYAFIADTETENSTQYAIYIDKSTCKAYYGEVKNYPSYIYGQAMKVRNDGEVLVCTQSSSTSTDFKIGHFKINWDGTNVTYTNYVIQKNISSFSDTLLTHKYLSDIIFNDDKNQCYAVVLTTNSYGSTQRIILAKIEFSNGIFNTLTPLSTKFLSAEMPVNYTFLIGY